VLASSFARIARLASLAICLIAVASFVGFAVEQSKDASAHQQVELGTPTTRPPASTGATNATSPKRGVVHEALDETSAELSSPFSSLTNQISSQWTLHIVDTLLLLLVYGFGLGLLARVVRVGE
jgi:hypothetical protein